MQATKRQGCGGADHCRDGGIVVMDPQLQIEFLAQFWPSRPLPAP